MNAAAALDAEAYVRDLASSSFGSAHGTLVHILGADWIWLQRWKGDSPGALPADWDLSTLEAVRRTWDDVDHERDAFLAGLGDADLDRTFDYRNMKGEPFRNTLGEALRHVVNHATYHRGSSETRPLPPCPSPPPPTRTPPPNLTRPLQPTRIRPRAPTRRHEDQSPWRHRRPQHLEESRPITEIWAMDSL